MGKIRHLRLCRPEEREVGLGRDELAVLLGEEEPEEKTAATHPPALPRQQTAKRRRGETR